MNRPDRERYPETTSLSCVRSSSCLPRARLLFLSFQLLGRRLDATSCTRPQFPGRQCKAQINHHVLVLVPIPIMILDRKVFMLPGCGVLLPKLKYLEPRRLRHPFCTGENIHTPYEVLHTQRSTDSILEALLPQSPSYRALGPGPWLPRVPCR